MGLAKCKSCGKIFNGPGFRGMCKECIERLEDLYAHSKISDYIRKHINEKDFDPDEAAHDLRMNPRDVKLLYDNGFLERDIQVYSSAPSRRQKLAEELQHGISRKNLSTQPAVNRIQFGNKAITYGGRKYERRY